MAPCARACTRVNGSGCGTVDTVDNRLNDEPYQWVTLSTPQRPHCGHRGHFVSHTCALVIVITMRQADLNQGRKGRGEPG